MRIKSNFKDYYDHIAHIYGGGDPAVTYSRVRIKEKILVDIRGNESTFKYNFISSPHHQGYQTKSIVICNKTYSVATYVEDLNVIEPWQLTDVEFWKRYIKRHKRDWQIAEKLAAQSIIEGSPKLLEYSRLIGQPVFELKFDHDERLWYAGENIPTLAHLGFPPKISPEQMYQDISYFMANTININPDIRPPVEVEDKYKIVGAGFDLKQSFRHRRQ